MKIALRDCMVKGGGIGNPGRSNLLTASLQAAFNTRVAKKLNCFEELYDSNDGLREFRYHGLKIAIPEARVEFAVNGQKPQTFPCSVKNFEIEQQKDAAALRFKLVFARNKIEAFSLLFGDEESPQFATVTIEGAQQELPLEPEEKEETEVL